MEIGVPCTLGPVAVDLDFIIGNAGRTHDVLDGLTDITCKPLDHRIIHIIVKSPVRDEHHGNHFSAVVGELFLPEALNLPNRDSPAAINVHIK